MVEAVFGVWAQFRMGLIPNSLTLMRGLAGPCFLIFHTGAEEWFFYALLLLVVSDAEGQLARWLGCETNLGRVADPLADKSFVNCVLALYLLSGGPYFAEVLFLLIISVLYDADNTWRRRHEILEAFVAKGVSRGRNDPNWLSKTKTAAQLGTVLVLFVPEEVKSAVGALGYDRLWIGVTLALVWLSWLKNSLRSK